MSLRRILFDANPAVGSKPTGIGYYTKGLMGSISGAEDVSGFYFDFLGRNAYSKSISSFTPVPVVYLPGRILSLLARKTGIQVPIELLVFRKYDWIIYPNYVSYPSLRKTKNILLVHDLAFLDMPETLDEKNLAYMKKVVPKSIKRATNIVCISHFTKSRLLHHFPYVNPDNIVVTGIPSVIGNTKKTHLSKNLTSLGITTKKYFLFLATLEPRKNVSILIDAYLTLPESTRREYSLVLAGNWGWKSENLRSKITNAKKRGHNIITTGYITDDERSSLYSNANLYVLPSLYEGFGMPLIEAMSFNTYCIVSDIPVFREVAEDSIAYFDQNSSMSISKAIQDNINKKPDFKTYERIVKKYSWDTVGKLLSGIINEDT